MGLLGTGWSPEVDGERFGAGKAELFEVMARRGRAPATGSLFFPLGISEGQGHRATFVGRVDIVRSS